MGPDRNPFFCIFLCGDVMTGRGIDQALSHPGNPALFEPCVRDARDYIELAEQASGPIPRPLGLASIWGDTLAELARAGTDARLINLETSLTRSEDYWPGKGIHYRMAPANVGCLVAARIDGCSLANNHVLDWGYAGLAETIATLNQAGIAHAGAGGDSMAAEGPAIIMAPGRQRRILFFSSGSTTSGIPQAWAARRTRPGIRLLKDLAEPTARRLANQMRTIKQPGDIAVASIHWGSNWGYDVPQEQTAFAHRLIEEGFDILHGHSSHHVRPIEVYQDRLILYGCGDFINDYEGIRGYEAFRGDLSLMYLVKVDGDGRLAGLRLVPFQMRQFQLHQASKADAAWLCALLNRLGAPLDTQARLADDQSIILAWR